MLKQIIVFLVLVIVEFAVPYQPDVRAATDLSDVPKTSWAYSAITNAVNQQWMLGYIDGTFRPNQLATRAEAAAAIAKSIGLKAPLDYQPAFQDISTDVPYANEIRALAYGGIIDNTNAFYPNAKLERAQIAKILSKAYQIEIDNQNHIHFTDYPSTYWAKNYIESLADAKLIQGLTTTKFGSSSGVTRAQLAVFVQRGIQFKQQVAQYKYIYDYLSKDYLVTTNDYKLWTAEVVRRVNDERAKQQLPALTEDPALTQLAIIKAQDMVNRNYFEHKSPFYGNPWDMAAIFDYDFTSFGENIARGFDSPKTVVDGWMNSEKHRENIMRSNYTWIGVGVKKDTSGRYIWVQQFSSK